MRFRLVTIIISFLIIMFLFCSCTNNSNQPEPNTESTDSTIDTEIQEQSNSNNETKLVALNIDLSKVNKFDYKPMLFVNSVDYTNQINEMSWLESVNGLSDLSFHLSITSNTKTELKLDNSIYYECTINYDSGKIDDEKYYIDTFS